ncbi:hypothetical protein ACRALDRAFT_1071824 [Sodiomyces alcalophilus JCM 7366]|uniref:uncharacterized protein n=1 Tax=Sodiomyces alcalophilus JCM 7366 TaxID=591952 RepID=UPI0039B67B40
MNLKSLLLLPLLTLGAAALEKSTAATTTSLTLSVPPSPPSLGNPSALPPTTHATLISTGEAHTALLSPSNTFVFRNVSVPGSYLVHVHSKTHSFVPLRLDVAADGSLAAWETFRGNVWDNRGEALRLVDFETGKGFEVRVAGAKGYFVERSKFSLINIILKNPMILMGLGTMALFFGMPYLLNNMDPELRAEFEERQRANPMNNILGGGGGAGANPMGGFDVASFLAGSGTGAASGSGTSGNSGRKNEGRRR